MLVAMVLGVMRMNILIVGAARTAIAAVTLSKLAFAA
jgi:hypothetical protein